MATAKKAAVKKPAAPGVDIDALSADDRTTFKVYTVGGLNDAGEEQPGSAGFVVVGPHSAEFRKAQAKLGARVIALMREAEKAKPKDGEASTLSDEEQWMQNSESIERRARVVAECCTVGLFGFTSAGKPVAYTAQAAAKLFSVRPLWAFTVMRAVENEANFTKG